MNVFCHLRLTHLTVDTGTRMAVYAQASGLRLFLGIQLPCLLSVDAHHPVHSRKGHSGRTRHFAIVIV